MGSRRWTGARIGRERLAVLLKGQDPALRWPPSTRDEGLRPEPFKPSVHTGRRRLCPRHGGWKKGPGRPGNGRFRGAVMWQPDSEPRKFPFLLTSSTNWQPWGCRPLRLEMARQERELGHWQRRLLLVVNTALSTLSRWRDTVEATLTPNLGP